MTEGKRDTRPHAETMVETIHDPAEPDLDALYVTDAHGTNIWLAPYEDREAWQVYIRNRQRYDSDTRRDETEESVVQLLAGAIEDELNGMGTSVNYVQRGDTPL
jgi:hypothetical protein